MDALPERMPGTPIRGESGCQAPPVNALFIQQGCNAQNWWRKGRAAKRAVSDYFGREFFSVEQSVGAKYRQRGHSSEARWEEGALNLETSVEWEGGSTTPSRCRSLSFCATE